MNQNRKESQDYRKTLYDNAARELALYIYDNDCEQESYEEYIKEHNDPRDHILYHAAVILGDKEDFQADVNNYLRYRSPGMI